MTRAVVTTACPACPFRRTAARGWLGGASGDPKAFLAPHWFGDLQLPCHMQVDWEAPDADCQVFTAPLCRGLMITMKNCAKMPHSGELNAVLAGVEPDRETFFHFPHEFLEHHTLTGSEE